MRHEHPRPGNEDEFEECCLRFFRHVEGRGGLVRYGKRGESQHGIDLIDLHGVPPRLAVQCKRREPLKKLSPNEIREEVRKAEGSAHPIDRYIIATTAKKSRESQDAVLELNRRPGDSRSFTVEILFWEDICGTLDGLDRVLAEGIVYGHAPGALEGANVAQGPVASWSTSASSIAATGLYADIDRLFEARRIEAAEHEIQKLPNPECNASLPTDDRYAILRLRAKLALEREDFDEASRLFLLAYEASPEKLQARLNRLIALELAGQASLAFQEATALADEGESSVALASLLVRTAPSRTALAAYDHLIQSHVEDAEDINVALVHASLGWNDLERARAAAHRAARLAPESAHALFARATVAHHEMIHGDWRARTEHAERALAHYRKAADAARRDRYRALVPEALTNRARVSAALGDVQTAASDYRAGVEAASRPSRYAEDAVAFFEHFGDYRAAKEMLASVDANSDRRALLAAVVDYNLAPEEERRRALTKMRDIAVSDASDAIEASYHAVQWSLDLGDTAFAATCVTDALLDRRPLTGLTLRGWIALTEGDREEALALAQRALDAPSDAAHPQELGVLARLLYALEDDTRALGVFERVYTPGVLNDECRGLIMCAQRLGRDDTLLRVCGELKATGQIDDVLRRAEVQLLLRYDPQQAYERAGEYLAHDEPYFQSVRNYAAAVQGQRERIVLDTWTPPRPGDLPPEEAGLVLKPLVTVGRHAEAIDYAYHLLRHNFASERAHIQYVWHFLTLEKRLSFPRHRTVVAGAAVLLQNERTASERWIILEPDSPDPSRGEFSPARPPIASLVNKRVGDRVEDLGGPNVPAEPEVIRAIENKYVFRFQDAIKEFSRRFPGSPFLQPMHVGSGDEFDPAPLIEVARDRRAHVERSLAIYRANPCSLHFLAEQLGLDVRRLMLALAAIDDNPLKCVDLPASRFDEAVEDVSTAKSLVIDLSAIVTICRLNAWPLLDPGTELLVTRSTKLWVDAWREDLQERASSAGGSLQITDQDQLCVQEWTDEQHASELNDVSAIVTAIAEHCRVVGTTSAAALDPKQRELYLRVLGPPSLDALCLAREQDAVLWTDDHLVALVARAEFDVARAWSQAVLRSLLDRENVSPAAYSQATARLLEWNYVSTVWTARDLLEAARLAAWDTGAPVFVRGMSALRDSPIPIARRTWVVVELLRLLGTSECPDLRKTAVIQAILDALGHTAAVKWLYRRLHELFEPDPIWTEFLRDEFRYWLRLR